MPLYVTESYCAFFTFRTFDLKVVKKMFTATKMAITQSIFSYHTCYTYQWKRNFITFSDHTLKCL